MLYSCGVSRTGLRVGACVHDVVYPIHHAMLYGLMNGCGCILEYVGHGLIQSCLHVFIQYLVVGEWKPGEG